MLALTGGGGVLAPTGRTGWGGVAPMRCTPGVICAKPNEAHSFRQTHPRATTTHTSNKPVLDKAQTNMQPHWGDADGCGPVQGAQLQWHC